MSSSSVHVFDHRSLIFFVNGKRIDDDKVDPRTTLAVYLRDHLKLTGTKIGCNEGGCGACTVCISDVDPVDGNIRYYSANACLLPVCAVFGKHVQTVEGIGSVLSQMHPVQERLAKAHGSQCGFCTPGFVMAMYSLLRNNPHPTEKDVNLALQGNLCRCTGYRPILEAFYSFVDEHGHPKVSGDHKDGAPPACGMGDACCRNKKTDALETKQCAEGAKCCGGKGCRPELVKLSNLGDCARYDPSQELIFPPELKVAELHTKSFALDFNEHKWLQPNTLKQLLHLKKIHPNSRLVAGNSEVGVELKFRHVALPAAINPKQIVELRQHYVDKQKNAVFFGSGLSLNETDRVLQKHAEGLPEHTREVIREVHSMVHWFAGTHVRNVATVAGNIATASPISDLNPIWMAARAEVVLESEERGRRTVPIDDKFFLGYRKSVIQPDEVVVGVFVPLTRQNELVNAYKQAQRREDDIAIVTGAFRVRLDEATHEVEDIGIAYGGMAPTTKMALETMKLLRGRKWDKTLLETALASLQAEYKLPPDVPGGMPRFRQVLVQSFFLKFYLSVCSRAGLEASSPTTEISDLPSIKLSATQAYQDVSADQPLHDACGRPLQHASGAKHTTGEALYCNDIQVADCLHLVLVLTNVASGRLVSIDASKALQLDGVVAFFDHKDVAPGRKIGGHNSDTPVFCDGEVLYHGQPVGAIVAVDHETARRAAARVAVHIEPANKPVVVSIEDAFQHDSFHFKPMYIHSALLEQDHLPEIDWSQYEHVIQGQVRMNGQEHFYLETGQCIVIPREDNELEVISSSQGVADTQGDVAAALGLPRHKIVVKVKRIGGGFGGKESTAGLFAAPAALAAVRLRRPIKVNVERFDDMAVTGTRHPFRFDYRVAVGEDKKLRHLEVTCISNGGATLDLSIGVTQRAMVHIDNVYKWPHANITGLMAKTNTASNTAYRGFGGPQGMFATEAIMAQVAETQGWDVDEFREANMYHEGDVTPFGMTLRQCNVIRCWEECRRDSNYDERKKAVEQFNRENRYRKKGIYLLPTKFGIGFGLQHLNQAGALLHVYLDGTVLISHGGMEMGQGLHTKILQIASRCLELPIEMIHINETSTDKVPNASATAASVGSDLNGVAVLDACKKIMDRLEPFRKADPEGGWKKWVVKAYQSRVPLSTTGFGIIHSEVVDWARGKGAELFGYCVYGVICAEVVVDCLTGDHHLLRADICMDVGESLNPAVDIGQIEGAFIQGYGLFTMEEIKIRPDGIRLTRGPGTYKIPSADDVPRDFHVRLLRGSSNKMAIFASKAIGEPPLFLGCGVLFAIREAVKAYRADHGKTGYFRFDAPATPERIRLACEDDLLQTIDELPDPVTYRAWTVPL